MTKCTCPRCGYKTTNYGNMKAHITRKIMCKPLLKDDIASFEEFKNLRN